MKALVVFAHPEPRSFTGAMRDTVVQTLTEEGHEVEISDLYAMNFNPVPGWHDFVDHDRAESFRYEAEQKRAHEAGSFASDLVAEMQKLSNCDALIFVFPLWWYGLPAILKGWVDRVFASGYAYSGGHWYHQGVFRGKRSMLCLTTGGPASSYGSDQLQGPIGSILYPIHHGILQFTGFDVAPPFVAYGSSYATPEAQTVLLDQLKDLIRRLPNAALFPFPQDPTENE